MILDKNDHQVDNVRQVENDYQLRFILYEFEETLTLLITYMRIPLTIIMSINKNSTKKNHIFRF